MTLLAGMLAWVSSICLKQKNKLECKEQFLIPAKSNYAFVTSSVLKEQASSTFKHCNSDYKPS